MLNSGNKKLGVAHQMATPSFIYYYLLVSGKTFRRYNICTYDVCEPPVKDIYRSADGPINGARPSGCINWEHLYPGVLANARTPRLLSGDTFGVLPCGLVDV